jgi:protein-L-isoaspartate(D-aspartate) O-methyltransferase
MTDIFVSPHPDFTTADDARARHLMVEGQLRPTKVTDRAILAAMRDLPRERFLPPALASLAYIDADIALGGGRVMMKPLVIARLLQLAGPVAGESALVVGAGTGYAAAVLACCGLRVTALENDPALLAIARGAVGTGVELVAGTLTDGAAGSRFDVILIEGAVREIPPAFAAQLTRTGRLVTVMAAPNGASYAVLAEPSGGALRARPAFDATTSLLPGLAPAPSFAF